MAAVFITQEMLQAWADQGKVRLDDTTLTLLQEKRTVQLKPAVRFTKLIDAGNDPNALVGKVKSKEQLVALGAEHYLDSVILGDTGYHVVEGFLGDLSPPKKDDTKKATPAPVDTVPATTVPPGQGSELEKEAEELSRLFLNTVRD